MRSPRSPLFVRALALLVALASVSAACSDEADVDPLASDATTEAGDGGGEDGTGGGRDDGADVPEGWKVVEGDGVSLAVPEDWVGVPIEDFAMSEDDLREAMPEADDAMLQQAASVVEQGGVLLAFGPPEDGFTDNVNILALPVPATIDQLEAEAELGMRQVGADVRSMERVELPAGDAVRVRYSAEFQSPDGPYVVEGVQLYVPVGDETYVLTVERDERTGRPRRPDGGLVLGPLTGVGVARWPPRAAPSSGAPGASG